VGVRLEHAEDTAVIVHPREKSWGPNYARFGLTMSTDGEGESAFNVLGDFRATWLNRRALEWRSTGTLGDLTALTSELLQPLDLQRKWFVTGGIDLGQRIDDFIVDDVSIARFRNRGARATVNVGRYIGRLGEARAGYEYGRVSSTRVSGEAGIPSSEDDIGAIRFQFTADRLDSWDFPSRGYYAAADVRVAQGSLGSDLDYERYELDLQKAFGLGRHGLTIAARFGETVGDSVPVYDSFALGGFQNLSGALERQLLGRDVLFGRVVYRYQLRGIEALADRLFLGGSLEAGRIQDRLNGTLGTDEDLRFATSAFLAASTVLGPVYLGGGVSEGGDRAFYLFVGRP
jgi:NTE family protein